MHTQKEKFKDDLRAYALNQGIDMLGFANIDRFRNAPPEFHPRNLYARANTVVVLGIRVLRGLMESLDQGMRIPYNAHGYGGINELFMRVARQRVACWIEDHGYTAVPVIQWMGSPHQEPIICHRTAAVAAGLGEFGWSKAFLSKRFGPLQRFGIVLTDAELPSDPLQINQICDNCKLCVKACPGRAIPLKEAYELEIDGQVIRHAKVDMYRCTRAHHGTVRATYPRPRADFDVSDIDAKYEALRKNCKDDTEDYVLGQKAVNEVGERYPHPIFGLVGNLGRSCAYCGAKGCFRACLAHLEKKGLIENNTRQPYVPSEPPSETVKYKYGRQNAVVFGE